jgi:hypothetical protein
MYMLVRLVHILYELKCYTYSLFKIETSAPWVYRIGIDYIQDQGLSIMGKDPAILRQNHNVLKPVNISEKYPVWRRVSKGVENGLGHPTCGQATLETAVRPFQGWSTRRA